MSTPIQGVAILLWACEPEAAHRLATPLFHAAAAAAMDMQVEIYFSARSVLLLKPGVAQSLRTNAAHPKTVADSLAEAVSHGARLLACSDALAAHALNLGEIEPHLGHPVARGGAVQFMARVADRDWRALVF